MRILRPHMLLPFGVLCATACISTTTGAEGNLKFSYSTTDDVGDFNKPIAVGAKLDVRVYDAGDTQNDDAIINEASSSDASILKVAKGGGNTMVVEAVAAGSAEISVDATVASSNTVESDRITMRAAVPEVITLTHLCGPSQSKDAFYLVNQEAYIGFDMAMNDGQKVIGYGYYPLAAEPAVGATIKQDSKEQDFVILTTGSAPGEVKLSSQVSEASWTLKLVEEGAIDGAVLEDPEAVGVGKTDIANVLPTTQGSPICQAKAAFTVASTTPEVCEVTTLMDPDLVEGVSRKQGWVEISGKAVGDCKFTVSYPQANAGEGLEVELQVSVENQQG